MKRYYRRLGRYSAALAFAAEIAIATLGGALKRKESLSARLGTSCPSSTCCPRC